MNTVITGLDKVKAIAAENPFLQLLAQLDSGRVVTDLTEDYPKLVEAVKRTGMGGTITLTINVKPDGKGEVETVEVHAKATSKLPKKSRKGTTFYVEEKTFMLTRIDPKQTDMFEPELSVAEQVEHAKRSTGSK